MGFSFSALKKPFLCLAPMEEVTDTVFRQMVATLRQAQGHGPDVMFTEFTNVEGLCSDGYEEVSKRLKFTEGEKPIVAQVWGKDPKKFYEAAKLIKRLRFDGIDINMGCPQKEVVKNGACIALINNRILAGEIVDATRKGAGGLPISVKTRIGLNKVVTEDWCGFLLGLGLDALTVHGRTAKQMSQGAADWGEIGKAVKLRDKMKLKAKIIGNGDVKNAQEAEVRSQETGVDGVMIGRGVFENMAAFGAKGQALSAKGNIDLLREHLRLWEETWGNTRSFAIMKKFVKAYVRGWEGAAELRMKLFETNSAKEMEEVLGSV